jgi:hypothetical protein
MVLFATVKGASMGIAPMRSSVVDGVVAVALCALIELVLIALLLAVLAVTTTFPRMVRPVRVVVGWLMVKVPMMIVSAAAPVATKVCREADVVGFSV